MSSKKKFLIKPHTARVLMNVAITVFFLLNAVHVTRWNFIETLENASYDARLRATMPGGRDERVIIIDIDEKSLAEEGRWPWPRNRVATLINLLFDQYEIALLGMDVVWAEPDESSGLKILETLADGQLAGNREYLSALDTLRPALLHDDIFAQSLKNRSVVLGYYFNMVQSNKAGVLPKPLFTRQDFGQQAPRVFVASGYGANLPMINDAAAYAGHFNYDPDTSVVRKAPVLIRYEDGYYASLSLAMARQIMGGAMVDIVKYEDHLQVGGYRIPVDENTRTLIPYRGPQDSFRYLSAIDILNGEVPKDQMAGKIALLGTSAPGLLDLVSAPVQNSYPGVEVHANIIAGFIDQNIKHSPAWVTGVEIIVVLGLGLLISLLLPRLSPLGASVSTIAILAAAVVLNMYIWQIHNIVLPLASTLLLVVALYVVNMSYGYFVESRGKRHLAGLFEQYIPPEIVTEMSHAPEHFSLEGDSRHMTVFFSDVRNFTSIAEPMKPADLQNLMNGLLTPLTRIIHQYQGTIDKYMGDAVMAFWGAPIQDQRHAKKALHAALDILSMLEKLRLEFQARDWPVLEVGIGLHTGVMHVGDMGSEFRKAYTVMGDAVNLGSRLEGLTKQYGVSLVVSETTRNAVDDVVYRELDMVRVKGKDTAIKIFEPLGKKDNVDAAQKHEIECYEQARQHYKAQQWSLAKASFLDLQKQAPATGLYDIYLKRILYFIENPPGDDWDGVFTQTTK